MTDFFAPYRALNPVARLVAMAYGVAHPNSRTAVQMSQLLKRTGFKSGRRVVPVSACKAACAEVLEAGIIHKARSHGRLVADPDWAPWLKIEAFRRRKLGRIERMIHSDRENRWHDEVGLYETMDLQCHVVAGRFRQLEQEFGDDVEPDDWGWLASQGAGTLLAKLPKRYLGDAVKGCVASLTDKAADPELALSALDGRLADAPEAAADVAFVRVLQGRRDEALAVFDELPGELREGKPVRTGVAATRALVATLEGDNAGALRHIETAIAEEKAGTRKRNIFPTFRAFAMSLLALVRDHAPANAEKLEHLLRIAGKVDADPSLMDLVTIAVHLREGGGLSWARHCGSPTLIRLWEGLFACWLGDFSEYGSDSSHGDERFSGLSGFTTLASANGYGWMAAECLEVVGRISNATGREVKWVSVNGEETPPGEAAALLHRDMRTTTLADLVAPLADWEYSLRGIEQFAYEARKKKPGRRTAAAGPTRRLAWILEIGEAGDIAISPKEQRGYKNGRWSKGRAVALKRLQAQAATMDFLIDQDRAAAASIVQNTYRWSSLPAYYLPLGGIHALAGHPAVFNQAGDPVEIVRRDPELVLEERHGILRARVNPHVADAITENYHVVMASDVRCEVTHFTKGHKRLCAAIPAAGLELPIEARRRLLDAISALAGEIRVQGVIGDAGLAAERVDADPRPWVQMEPSGPGLRVAVLVEPVPESGAYFQPGLGGTAVFARLNGKAIQARRDLVAETRELGTLVSACPMLGGVEPDAPLTLPDPADCLELVDQLDVAKARCLWPRGQPFRIVARAGTASLRLSVRSAADWFSTSGELDIDGKRALGLSRLFEMMDGSPAPRFVELESGAFVSLTSGFHRQLADLRAMSAPSGGERLRLHPLAALALVDFFDDTRLDADSDWRAHRRTVREAQAFEPETPSTLQAELRPYQEEGFRWLSRLSRWGAGACLADDMGLGKTVQALAALLDRGREGPALVVAPTSLVSNWLAEARRFAPTLDTRPYIGTAASRVGHLEGLGPFDVVVTTYGLLHNDIDALAAIDWNTIVLDEAQAIKNPATKRARAARKLKGGFRLVTTGTPIQNNLMDLYSLFAFVNPGMLGSMKSFREKFALPIERDGDPAARARLRRLIAPFMLRRVKAEVLDDLPARTEVTLPVEMSPEEAALYEALRLRALEDLEASSRDGSDGGDNRLRVLAHLTRLRLACCNPRLVHSEGPESSKLRTFATTLDELRQGRHKVLVFSQFVRHLKLIEEHLVGAGISYQYLDGATTPKQRTERIAAFQAGQGDVFLISLRAGGVGLNLTAADYVIHMDPWWNPAAEDQASDRAHRIGQTRPVTVYRLVAKGTIEEQIVELHRHKRELADRLLEGADAPGRLSAEELLALLRG